MCCRAGKENNGFDPNIQLVPGGSWNGPKPAGGAAPAAQPSAGARPTGAPAPATTFTLPSGGWASGPSNAAPPPSSKKDFTELGAAGAARKGAVKGTTAAARKGAGSEGRQKGSGSAPRAQGATATKNPFDVLEDQEDDE